MLSGRRHTNGGFRRWRWPPLESIKKLLERFDAERQEEARLWTERMQEKELFAMKRARSMGWKRTDGSDLKLERLSDLPADRWIPNCPNDLGGYQYITEITIIDRSVETMLDTGAACNTIPEELVTAMLRRCAKLGIPQGSQEFPVLALERWKVPEHVEGVAAGKKIDLLGSVVLRVEMGCKHDRTPVYEKIRCKIFARGSASFNGIISGGRTLDAVSQGGMGLQIRDKSYYLALYEIVLPRLEGPKRKRRGEAMH